MFLGLGSVVPVVTVVIKTPERHAELKIRANPIVTASAHNSVRQSLPLARSEVFMKVISALCLIVACSGLVPNDVFAQSVRDDDLRPLTLERDEEEVKSLTNGMPSAHSRLSVTETLTADADSEEAEDDSAALRSVLSEESEEITALDVSYCRFAGCCDACCEDPRGFKFTWAPDRWTKVGAAIRTSFNTQTFTPGGLGNYFTINNARLLTSGQVTEYIGFELNTDVNLAQSVTPTSLLIPDGYNLLDAIVKFETGDLFNIWAGQFLPPSDRSNIDGPFFINGWDYPFVSNYPAIFQGRQLGAAYWGQWNEGMFKWSAGAFNGTGTALQSPYTNPPDLPPNANHNIMFDARLTLNLLDAEPGYYHQSSYYGQKNILAIAVAMQTQNRATGTAADPAAFTGLNLDVLYEHPFENSGVLTLEGALYSYNDQDLVTSSRQGEAGFVYAGYILPANLTLGPICGRLRPYTRYQQYNRDFIAASTGQYSQGVDVGTEYVMNGPNARVTAVWSQRELIGSGTIQLFTLGAQMIF